MSVPSTPKAADSVGVAIPKIMKPMTKKITKLIGITFTATSRILDPHDSDGAS